MVTPVKKKVRRKIKKSPVEAKAKEKKAPIQANPVADALKKIQIASEMQMRLLREEIKNIKINASQPPVEWIFDIIRDEETGLIRQIKASADSAINKNKLN